MVPEIVADPPEEDPTNTLTTPDELRAAAMYVQVESDTAIDEVTNVELLVVG
jgi:hypothetical protein